MILRDMRPEDVERGLELCRLAGFNQVRADWEYFVPHAFVAEVDGRVVGTCAVLDREGPVGWIAMMLVDPAVRRQSIGTRLFEHVLSVTTAGSVGLDATAMGRPLYEKYGFVQAAEIVRMKGKGLSCSARSGVVGRWREGFASNQIGPIVAGSVEEAAGLVCGAVAAGPRDSWIIDVPAGAEPAWHDWLKSVGFVSQRPLARMFRGEARELGGDVYATSGPEYGVHTRKDG